MVKERKKEAKGVEELKGRRKTGRAQKEQQKKRQREEPEGVGCRAEEKTLEKEEEEKQGGEVSLRGGRARATPLKEKIKVVMNNTGGAPGCWRLLEEAGREDDKEDTSSTQPDQGEAQADVIMIQELRMKEEEWKAFARQAKRQGYEAYREQGEPSRGRWGEAKENGGVATLVLKTLPQKVVRSERAGTAQALVVKVADWNVINTYGPPTETGRRQIVEVATNVFEANNWREEAWLWG